MEWITDNLFVLISIALGLKEALLLICSLTPTPKDDILVGKIYKWLERIAGVTKKLKELPGAAKLGKTAGPDRPDSDRF